MNPKCQQVTIHARSQSGRINCYTLWGVFFVNNQPDYNDKVIDYSFNQIDYYDKVIDYILLHTFEGEKLMLLCQSY